MIDFLCGEVVSVNSDNVVIKCNNIGYKVFVSANTASSCAVGDSKQLFTYLQVKEDGILLYGFASRQEQTMFERLITVSGIGCKMAVQILGGLPLNDLAVAIIRGDSSRLTQIKGLGKKTAERLILELKEKLGEYANVSIGKETLSIQSNPNMDEALGVLVALGLSKSEATAKAQAAVESGAITTEQIIQSALRNYK